MIREELRNYINEMVVKEADEMTPERVADEWRRAGSKIKSVAGKVRNYFSPEAKAERLRKKQRKHQYKSTSHAIKAKKYGIKHTMMTDEGVEYQIDPEKRDTHAKRVQNLRYLKWRRKKLKRQYKYGS